MSHVTAFSSSELTDAWTKGSCDLENEGKKLLPFSYVTTNPVVTHNEKMGACMSTRWLRSILMISYLEIARDIDTHKGPLIFIKLILRLYFLSPLKKGCCPKKIHEILSKMPNQANQFYDFSSLKLLYCMI